MGKATFRATPAEQSLQGVSALDIADERNGEMAVIGQMISDYTFVRRGQRSSLGIGERATLARPKVSSSAPCPTSKSTCCQIFSM